MHIVLDKSYLQGSSKDEVHRLGSKYRLIMPEVLFLEILTTKEENIAKCFKKLPPIENPVDLVPSVGSLIRYEISNNQPCTPLENQFLKIRYVFNPRLAKNQFSFTTRQKETLEEWEDVTLEYSQGFAEKSVVIGSWFPELKEYVPGDSSQIIENAMLKVARNRDLVMTIYGQLRDEIYRTQDVLLPEPTKIDQNWILFRYLQVHLVASIEYVRKYGNRIPDAVSKRLINERLDIDYCIIGTLADGLATGDKTMAKFYKLLCHEKTLIFLTFEASYLSS